MKLVSWFQKKHSGLWVHLFTASWQTWSGGYAYVWMTVSASAAVPIPLKHCIYLVFLNSTTWALFLNKEVLMQCLASDNWWDKKSSTWHLAIVLSLWKAVLSSCMDAGYQTISWALYAWIGGHFFSPCCPIKSPNFAHGSRGQIHWIVQENKNIGICYVTYARRAGCLHLLDNVTFFSILEVHTSGPLVEKTLGSTRFLIKLTKWIRCVEKFIGHCQDRD